MRRTRRGRGYSVNKDKAEAGLRAMEICVCVHMLSSVVGWTSHCSVCGMCVEGGILPTIVLSSAQRMECSARPPKIAKAWCNQNFLIGGEMRRESPGGKRTLSLPLFCFRQQ